jgi:hypothetical protein
MKSGRKSLTKRIALALALVAAIHLAFYVAPRIRYSRARFYPESYAAALGVLNDAFGEKAVEKKIVALPLREIQVPYEGLAVIYDRQTPFLLWVNPSGTSYAFRPWRGKPVEVWSVSAEDARRAWAVFEYLSQPMATIPAHIVAGSIIDYSNTGLGAFVDTTWPPRRVTTTEPPREAVINGTRTADFRESRMLPNAENAIRTVAWASEVKALCAPGGPLRRCEGAQARAAMKAAIFAHFPCQGEWDYAIAAPLAYAYAQDAGIEDLPFLKRLAARRAPTPGSAWPAWARNMPIAGAWLNELDMARHRYLFYSFDDVIWRMENLDGKSDEDQYAILARKALAPPTGINDPYPPNRARWKLAERWPARWRGYLANHYEDVKGLIDGIEGQGPYDRLTALIAADASSEGRYRALAQIYLATGDTGALKRLEDAAAVEKAGKSVGPQNGYSAVDTLAWCGRQQGERDGTASRASPVRYVSPSIAHLTALPTGELKERFANEKDDQERARVLQVLWDRARDEE